MARSRYYSLFVKRRVARAATVRSRVRSRDGAAKRAERRSRTRSGAHLQVEAHVPTPMPMPQRGTSRVLRPTARRERERSEKNGRWLAVALDEPGVKLMPLAWLSLLADRLIEASYLSRLSTLECSDSTAPAALRTTRAQLVSMGCDSTSNATRALRLRGCENLATAGMTRRTKKLRSHALREQNACDMRATVRGDARAAARDVYIGE